MALILSDRTKETTTTSGVADVILGGGFSGFQAFSSTLSSGDTTYYAIENGTSWEIGIGTYNSDNNSLSRDTVYQSSNSDNKISLTGLSFIFCSYIADKSIFADALDRLDMGAYSGIKFDDADLSNSGFNINDASVSGQLTLQPYNNQPLKIVRAGSGNFLHAYKDGSPRTLALYTDAEASPRWRLGLKSNSNNNIEPPDFGYVFGEDGQVGFVADSTNSLVLDNSANFNITHNSVDIFKASSVTGVHIDVNSNAYPALTVNGGASQSASLQEWTTFGGDILSIVDKDGYVAINKDSADYQLDVNGSGRLDQAIITGALKTSIVTSSDAATITFDMDSSNFHNVTLAGNRTLAVSGVSAGQQFIIRLVQDGAGNRTVTWFGDIRWAGGSAPTLTSTGGKADVFEFLCTSGNYYDGFIKGLNV